MMQIHALPPPPPPCQPPIVTFFAPSGFLPARELPNADTRFLSPFPFPPVFAGHLCLRWASATSFPHHSFRLPSISDTPSPPASRDPDHVHIAPPSQPAGRCGDTVRPRWMLHSCACRAEAHDAIHHTHGKACVCALNFWTSPVFFTQYSVSPSLFTCAIWT